MISFKHVRLRSTNVNLRYRNIKTVRSSIKHVSLKMSFIFGPEFEIPSYRIWEGEWKSIHAFLVAIKQKSVPIRNHTLGVHPNPRISVSLIKNSYPSPSIISLAKRKFGLYPQLYRPNFRNDAPPF